MASPLRRNVRGSTGEGSIVRSARGGLGRRTGPAGGTPQRFAAILRNTGLTFSVAGTLPFSTNSRPPLSSSTARSAGRRRLQCFESQHRTGQPRRAASDSQSSSATGLAHLDATSAEDPRAHRRRRTCVSGRVQHSRRWRARPDGGGDRRPRPLSGEADSAYDFATRVRRAVDLRRLGWPGHRAQAAAAVTSGGPPRPSPTPRP
jgi:hypothetical protein